MPTTITTDFRFDDVPLRVEADGHCLKLFGRADIVVDQRTWRIDAIQLYAPDPDRAPTPVLPDSDRHEMLSVALGQQFGDEIDELVTDAVERRGGYMALFGERMPAAPGYRGLPAYRPTAPFGRAMSRTFCL